jgi:putative hydrolase of the HAD superfamily
MDEQHIPVIAATNNDRRTIKVLDELGLSGYFAHVVVCGDLGWKKPSPFFFEGLERILGIPRGELLHVGNDRVLDVEAAHRIGMQALLYGVPQALSGMESVESFDQLSKRILASSKSA